MGVTDHSVVIQRPIEVVFDNTTCLKGCVNWISSLVKAEKVGDEPVHVGSQYIETYKLMGVVDQTTVTVTSYNRPYEFAYEDPKIPMSWDYKFTEVPEGTRVDVKLSLLAKTFGTLDAEVVNERASKQYEHDLQNLKVMLEAGVKVQATD